MKKIIVLAVTMLVGCHQQVAYSHQNGRDWLTVESYGDNLNDFVTLKNQANKICEERGMKNGIEILDSRPSGAPQGSTALSYYTLAWECKEESVLSKAERAATKVADAVNGIVKDK